MNTLTIVDSFIEFCKDLDVSDECITRIQDDIEKYDRQILDSLKSPVLVTMTDYGYYSIINPAWYRDDPYTANNYNMSIGQYLIAWDTNNWKLLSLVEAREFLYTHAKNLGFSEIPNFNNIQGYIIDFDTLIGSIPEFMRDRFEADPHAKELLRNTFQSEIRNIYRYLAMQYKNVKITNKDTLQEEYVETPISKISVQFNRFEQVPDTCSQSTAFFSVSDISPDFQPEFKPNWYLQDTSRWLYAGAIAINIYGDKVDISSHH